MILPDWDQRLGSCLLLYLTIFDQIVDIANSLVDRMLILPHEAFTLFRLNISLSSFLFINPCQALEKAVSACVGIDTVFS